MKIEVSKFKEGEMVEVIHDYLASDLNLELQGLHYLEALHLKGTAEKVVNSLFFKGILSSRIKQECSRCLRGAISAVSERFDLFYTLKGEEEIDPTDEIRDVMILSYPVKYLCSEDCRGLCPSCGADLNATTCSCQSTWEGSNPFGRLKSKFNRC